MAENEIIGRMNDFWAQSSKTKAAMSRELGVDAGTFNNILNGNRGVPVGMLAQFLATYQSVSAEWLMRGVGSMYAADGRASVNGDGNIANNNHQSACVAP